MHLFHLEPGNSDTLTTSRKACSGFFMTEKQSISTSLQSKSSGDDAVPGEKRKEDPT